MYSLQHEMTTSGVWHNELVVKGLNTSKLLKKEHFAQSGFWGKTVCGIYNAM